MVNNKPVCHTNFQDLIEIIQTNNHPIGRNNYFTTDRAWLNCLLAALSIIFFVLAAFTPYIKNEDANKVIKPLAVGAGVVLYCVMLIETWFS